MVKGEVPLIFFICFALNLVIFFLLWIYQEIYKNASYVDVAWSMTILLQAGLYFWWYEGHSVYASLSLFLVALWALRLTWHLMRRLVGEPEDSRYAKLRHKWGESSSRNFFWVHLMNAAVSFLMALSLVPLMSHQGPLYAFLYLGFGLGVLAVSGEALADRQLREFKGQRENQGQVLDRGLWRYSRHPNYFFEWLHWVAYGVMAFGLEWGWVSFLGAVVIYIFLTRITGVPFHQDKLKSANPQYLAYVSRTPSFFPWFPRGQTK